MGWRVGDPFRAMDTQDVKSSGMTPGSGGEVTSIMGAKISFYVEAGGPGEGFLEGHCNASTFSQNFAPDKGKETARRTVKDARIHPKTFPDDFFKTKKR
jgi:hypothetical protein